MLQSAAMRMVSQLARFARLGLVILFFCLILGSSVLPPDDHTEQVRVFTRDIEFDYVGWTADALILKLSQVALGIGDYLSPDARRRVVLEYLDIVARIQQAESQVNRIYADPNITDPWSESEALRGQLDDLHARRELVQPVAETVLQSQISYIVDSLDLSLGGQPTPPVLYHSTPLPLALIVSPRNIIRQDESISLTPDMTVDKRFELEEQIDSRLDVSSLVVRIGGVGVYPTMVMESASLDWLSEVIAHEWVHNYLTLRPLGLSYMNSPELRIMNETTAGIAGKEIGRAVLEYYYPELLPPPAPPPPEPGGEMPEPPAFDFWMEMHETRVKVDQMLAEGKIEEAEEYMEQRRLVFWDQGYHGLRKLNQAYFAFHSAYADKPGGAAGAAENPIGEAVRTLRSQSPSLAAFLKRIAWMSSYEQLKQTVEMGL